MNIIAALYKYSIMTANINNKVRNKSISLFFLAFTMVLFGCNQSCRIDCNDNTIINSIVKATISNIPPNKFWYDVISNNTQNIIIITIYKVNGYPTDEGTELSSVRICRSDRHLIPELNDNVDTSIGEYPGFDLSIDGCTKIIVLNSGMKMQVKTNQDELQLCVHYPLLIGIVPH